MAQVQTYMALFSIGSLVAVWSVSGDPVCYKRQRIDERNSWFSITDCNGDPKNVYMRFESKTDVTLRAFMEAQSEVSTTADEDLVTTEVQSSSQSSAVAVSTASSTGTSTVEEQSEVSTTAEEDFVTTEEQSSSQSSAVAVSTASTTSTSTVATTEHLTSTPCPPNMIFGNCTCGATCEDPNGEHGCYNNCTEVETCVCPEGFLMKEEHCVPLNECGCFLEEAGKVLPKNTFFVGPDCKRRWDCKEKELVCDKEYRCSPNASCDERHNLRQCNCKHGFVGNGKNCTLVTDCYDIFNAGFNESGIYTIQPSNWNDTAFEVFCNMSNGGGWTVFQRRVNGSVDFYLDWQDYKQGFGFLNHEFWLGNDKIFILTNQADYELRIDLVNRLGSPYYATYDLFRIGNEDDSYKLTHLGTFSGTTGFDALIKHRGSAFTTRDRDNDWANINCTLQHHGAWWWDFGCHDSNLNGAYNGSKLESIRWKQLPGDQFNISVHGNEDTSNNELNIKEKPS